MKKGSHFFVSLVLFTFLCVFIMPGLNTKAYSEFYFSDVSTTSCKVDFSEAAAKMLAKYPGGQHLEHTVKVRRYVKNGNTSLEQSFNIGAEEFQFTINNLKAGTGYQVEISMPIKYSGGTGTTYLKSDVTTRRTSTGYPIKLIGTTDKTMAIDYHDAMKSVEEYYAKKNWTDIIVFDVRIGWAAEGKKTNAKAALKNARTKALKSKLESAYGYRAIAGLKPDTKYAVFIVASVCCYNSKGDRINVDEYFEATGFKTDAAGGYSDDEFGDTKTDNSENGRIEEMSVKNYIIGNDTSEFKNMKYDTICTDNSITLDWSKVSGITTPKGKKNLIVSYVLDTDYDAYADKEKFGSGGNYGPNMRKAVKLADTKGIKVPKGNTSYTITGLEKGKRYCLVLKCGYKKDKLNFNPCYIVLKANTTGGNYKSGEEIEKLIKPAYMFDGTVKREKDTILLDWTAARNAYMEQDIMKDCYPRPTRRGNIGIYYKALPKDANPSEIKKVYDDLTDYEYDNFFYLELPITKARVYGLDMSKKYVFMVRVPIKYTANGEAEVVSDKFYFDETGTNFYKKKALGLIDDSNTPGGNDSGNDTPGGGEPSDNKPSDNNPGGNNNSGDDNSGKNNQSKDNTGNGASKAETRNSDGSIQVNEKKDDKAWISIDNNRVKASKLKKKGKTFSVKINNSKGKVTIKDISSKKLKKYSEISVKNKKITIKLKKGAPKGKYKYKVTVAAKGKVKKTTETVMIIVE